MSTSVIVLDCNGSNWGSLCERWSNQKDILKRLIASVIVYANTHLSMSVNSNLMIISAGSPLKNRIIFSTEESQKSPDISELIDTSIRTALQVDADSDQTFCHTNYANAFATGICCKCF